MVVLVVSTEKVCVSELVVVVVNVLVVVKVKVAEISCIDVSKVTMSMKPVCVWVIVVEVVGLAKLVANNERIGLHVSVVLLNSWHPKTVLVPIVVMNPVVVMKFVDVLLKKQIVASVGSKKKDLGKDAVC